MRNLETKFKVPLDCYFALCPAGGGEPFYTSDVERQTLNPMWKSISLSRFGSSLRVGVYVRTGDSGVSAETKASTDTKGPGAGWEPLLERDVDLSKLEFVQPVDRGQGIGSLQLIRAPNTLVFELADGIYMDSASAPKFSPRLPAKKTKPPLKITVAAILRQHTGLCGEPGAQYGFSQCMRALNEQKKFESELNGALMRNESRESNPRRVRASTARLERTRELVRKEQGELKTQLEVVRAVREELKPRCFQVLRLWEQLERHRQAMDKLSQQFNHLQKQRAVAATRLHLRKARMLWSLFNLYPIRKEVKSIGGQPMYYIRDCPMPDILAEGSALPVSVALGYCAHLILLAAKYLGVKLRYRIVHGGSKSVILDEAAATPWRVTLYYKDSDRR